MSVVICDLCQVMVSSQSLQLQEMPLFLGGGVWPQKQPNTVSVT